MWSAVLRFVAWCLTQAWRYGYSTVVKVANWAKANWRTVGAWLSRGLTFTEIIRIIINILF